MYLDKVLATTHLISSFTSRPLVLSRWRYCCFLWQLEYPLKYFSNSSRFSTLEALLHAPQQKIFRLYCLFIMSLYSSCIYGLSLLSECREKKALITILVVDVGVVKSRLWDSLCTTWLFSSHSCTFALCLLFCSFFNAEN